MSGVDVLWSFGTTQLITLVVAGLAFTGVLTSAVLRWRADRRDELWKRIEWAVNLSWHDQAHARAAGSLALELLLAGSRRTDAPQPPSRLTSFDVGHIELVINALEDKEGS